jgi:glycosyltransferase A (GT-A) superfamily protein (DUF2064 family)
MTMRVAIGVFAEPPLPSQCLPKLLAAYTPEWVCGLYAAMLRDTLDGLQSIDASEYLVFCRDADGDGVRALERHVPVPWVIVRDITDAASAFARLGAHDGLAILVRSDAPSSPMEPLAEAIVGKEGPFALLGPLDDGGAWLLGAARVAPSAFQELPWQSAGLTAMMRAQCTEAALPLVELPNATAVEEPDAFSKLLEELRRYPERAPRTAQFIVTRA